MLDAAIVDPLRQSQPDLWKRLVGVYLADAETKLGLLEQSLAGGDLAQVELIAHTLKSASANVGAIELSQQFRALEHGAGAGDIQRDTIADIFTGFEQASAALQESCGEGTGATAQATGSSAST